MAAEDELALPQVPEARPDDVEDVSWALSTAEAMWARGDHLEGIKWVRKAAEAASEVENDERALELAKAASDLATLVARRSRASIGDGPGLAGGAPPELFSAPTSAQPTSAVPTTTRSQAPPPAAPPAAPPLSSAPPARSSPPIPLPSMASQPAPPRSSSPVSGVAAPRPFAGGEARHAPLQGRAVLPSRAAAERPKPRRRSRENLDQEARAAGVVETAPLPAVDDATADRALRASDPLEQTATFAVPIVNRQKRRMRSDPEPTVVARLEDLQPHRDKSAAEWDASPTENLTGDDMDHMNVGDRQTAFAMPAQPPPPVVAAPMSPMSPIRPPQSTVHDPAIQTSQAVRVVVWRDANGVHVAPAGTVVSSITIDAVLVVLEEGADLTAWLSQRER